MKKQPKKPTAELQFSAPKAEAQLAVKQQGKTKGVEYVLKFAFEKETPGALRFRELDEENLPVVTSGAVVGVLYIRKGALPERKVFPRFMHVIVAAEY